MVIDLDRRYIWAAALLALILVFAGGMKYADLRNQQQQEPEKIIKEAAVESEAEAPTTDDIIQVYVTGAVQKPGVYRLPPDARVYEAIDLAQSLPTANLNTINLAQKLEDGQAILVPAQGEEPATEALGGGSISITASTGMGGGGKVNINTASVQELDEKLPGIGPTLAQRIVDYRKLHGPFAKIEDLNEVSGIGEQKFAEIKDLVVVR
ncbi:MAG: helix-hairpin-helix domain-containing protein [Syntrophomonadaceae bacterium]|nr:helix-hairpin-helix domain-containing protein [Syntrophomonadaceae bacterium]